MIRLKSFRLLTIRKIVSLDIAVFVLNLGRTDFSICLKGLDFKLYYCS